MNAEALWTKWGRIVQQSSHIWTWTENETLAYLAEQASKARFAVEFGVYLGRSSKVMLDANPSLHLWSCDLFPVAGTEFTARHFLRQEIEQGRCEIIVGDSDRVCEMLNPHMAGKIDFIFVDDGHAETDVMRDIRCGKQLLKSDGVMAGHDFDVPHNDVARGVIQSGIQYVVPVPRVWQMI